MKRKSLFNKIISLSIIATLYLSMSAPAYAEMDVSDEPVVAEEQVTEGEPVAEGEPTAVTDDELNSEAAPPEIGEQPAEGGGNQTNETIVDKIVDAIENLVNPDETPKAEGEGEVAEGEIKADAPEDETGKDKSEPQEGDTYFIITTNEDGTDIKATYEYVLNEETGELEAILKEEIEGKFDKDGNPIDEEKKECEHEYIYTSNKDGKHTVKCKNCDVEEFTESCDFDEEGICKKCGWQRLPDPVLVFEDDEVIVTVSGAVPENADLRVTPIKKDNDETKEAYEGVEKKLIDETDIEENDQYGFLAYDICFIDIETKEEVEPDGEVTVSMEYKGAVLPLENLDYENVDSVDVSLVHFNEQNDSIDDLTENSKAALELDDNKALTKAEFTSDTFSTYVITYKANSNTFTVKVVFNNLDVYKNNIDEYSTTEKDHNITINSREAITKFKDGGIPGYNYIRAEYNNKNVKELYYSKESGAGKKPYLKIIDEDGNQIGSSIEMKTGGTPTIVVIDMIYQKDMPLSVTKKATGPARLDDETEYIFKLLKKQGSNYVPASNVTYQIKGDSNTTDGEGIFKIKTGECADFPGLSGGNYKVVETGLTGNVYGERGIHSFKTITYVNGEKVGQEFSTLADDRDLEVEVRSGETKEVTFKNYYYEKNIETDKGEELTKYIRYYGDDKYELQLKFKGPMKVVTERTFEEESTTDLKDRKLNIILVIDKSESMNHESGGKKKIVWVQDAVKEIATIFNTKRHVEAKWKIVNFGTGASVDSNTSNWVSNDQLYTIASGNSFTSGLQYGTNYEAGLSSAINVFNTSAEADAEKIVIFLTDGKPTAYVGGQASANFVPEAYYRAKTMAKNLNCNAFYAIGVDFDDSHYNTGTEGNLSVTEILERITNEVNAGERKVSTVDPSNVSQIFSSIAGMISTGQSGTSQPAVVTTYLASGVTVSDPLSDYAEITKNSGYYIAIKDTSVTIDGEHPSNELKALGYGYYEDARNGVINSEGISDRAAEYDVYKRDASGNVIKDASGNPVVEATVRAEYDASSRTMNMVFPAGYQLPNNYTFAVVFKVEPTDKAYREYLSQGYGTTEGDVGTDYIAPNYVGTSAGKLGFRSNGKAVAIYDYDGEEDIEKEFPHPVLQVNPVIIWEMYKIDGEGKAVDGAEFLLKDTAENSELAYLGTSDYSKNGLIDWNLEDGEKITVGKVYTLTESKVPLGYTGGGGSWKFTLDEHNVPTLTGNESVEVILEENKVGNVFTYKYYFKNFKVEYHLPQTGGKGIYRTTIYGTLMMMCATYMFYRNKKKSKRFY